jgi:hypothetical protein
VWVGLAIGAALLLGGVAAGLWMVWQRWLQFCPHCAWVVRRVHHGWLRCSRCHKQYGRHAKLRPH